MKILTAPGRRHGGGCVPGELVVPTMGPTGWVGAASHRVTVRAVVRELAFEVDDYVTGLWWSLRDQGCAPVPLDAQAVTQLAESLLAIAAGLPVGARVERQPGGLARR